MIMPEALSAGASEAHAPLAGGVTCRVAIVLSVGQRVSFRASALRVQVPHYHLLTAPLRDGGVSQLIWRSASVSRLGVAPDVPVRPPTSLGLAATGTICQTFLMTPEMQQRRHPALGDGVNSLARGVLRGMATEVHCGGLYARYQSVTSPSPHIEEEGGPEPGRVDGATPASHDSGPGPSMDEAARWYPVDLDEERERLRRRLPGLPGWSMRWPPNVGSREMSAQAGREGPGQ